MTKIFQKYIHDNATINTKTYPHSIPDTHSKTIFTESQDTVKTHTLPPPSSKVKEKEKTISLTVSVDVKHHIYLFKKKNHQILIAPAPP